jgi:hypothetical protein
MGVVLSLPWTCEIRFEPITKNEISQKVLKSWKKGRNMTESGMDLEFMSPLEKAFQTGPSTLGVGRGRRKALD